MIKKLLVKVMKRRYFWRDVGFDELSEIYASMMFRSMAISLSGIFVPIYLLQLGYNLTAILVFFAICFSGKAVLFDLLAAHTTARFGPKHALIFGYVLLSLSTLGFTTLPQMNWPLWSIGLLWGGSASFFFIPFDVYFSKIKHKEHGGKELGFVIIVERIGNVIGPLVGGLVAWMFGGQALFLVSFIVLVFGFVPLVLSGEPVKIKQKLSFRTLPLSKIKRDIMPNTALGVENNLSISGWSLYLGLFVLVGGSSAYSKLGFISSASIAASVLVTYLIGSLIDSNKGRRLLRFSAVGNSILHLSRIFVSTYNGAFLVNVANEFLTVGYKMPFVKGKYDAVDGLPGHRIVYFASLEIIASTVKATLWFVLALLSTVVSGYSVMVIAFLIASVASLIITTERFNIGSA